MIVDAGPLIAALWAGDANHRRCAALLRAVPGPLQVPELVVTEVAHLIARCVGPKAELTFARSFRDGELFAEPVDPADWERMVELMDAYLDLPLGMADASVVALAERLGRTEIATLDRRHLSVVRPRHVDAFRLLPEG